MTPNYAYHDADGWVRQWSLAPRPEVREDGTLGPYQATPVDGLYLDLLPEGFEARRNMRKVDGAYIDMTPAEPQPSHSSELREVGGALTWVETATLADLAAHGLDAIDDAANAARAAVLARQTNNEEYHRVEPQARAFKDAGYPAGAVPSGVASWARAKWRQNWTAQDAADDIIATADAWITLLDKIRDIRLYAKEDVRHATNGPAIAVIVEQFKVDLANVMKAVP